ncbi:hypothetical protein GC173_17705 [bacterium]|nr:hypothetical protein [bacterium]
MRFVQALLISLLALLVQTSRAEPLIVEGTIGESGSLFVIRGATVYLEVTDMAIRRQVGYEQTQTGEDGTYRFDLSEKYGNIANFGLQVNAISPLHRQGLKIEKRASSEFPVKIDMLLAPGCSAKGRVVDDKGQPVPDALIESGGARKTRTAADGTFHIMGLRSESPNTIVARKDGFAQGRAELDPQTQSIIEGVEIVLTGGYDLKVHVVAPDGTTPVTSGIVYLAFGRRYLQERPDSNGEVQFKSVPVGETPDLRYTGPRYLFESRPVEDKEMTSGEATIQVEAAVFLTGRVHGPGGIPVYTDAITLEDRETGAQTRLPIAPNGLWRSGPLPRNTAYNLVVAPTGRAAQRAAGELEFLAPGSDGVLRARVDPWPAGFKSEFTVTQSPDGRVEMQRRDSGEGSVAGLVRYIGRLDDTGALLTGEVLTEGTTKAGRFTARAYNPTGHLDGFWDLREELPPTAPTGPGLRTVTTPPFPGRQVADVELTRANGLSGRALRPDGSFVPDGQAIIYGWKTTRAFRQQTPIASGIFLFDNLPPDPVCLVITDSDTGAASEPLWVIPNGQQIDVSLDEEKPDEMDELAAGTP